MKRVLQSCFAAVLFAAAWPSSIASADATSRARARAIGRIVMVLDELVLLEREIRATKQYGGKSDCANKRTGFGRGTVVDALQCFTKAQRKEIKASLKCSEIPTRTSPRAYLWLRKCANSKAAVRLWRGIDCRTTEVRYKGGYTNFVSHMTARKCKINQPRSCRVGDVVFTHNQMFVGYTSGHASLDADSRVGSKCADHAAELKCENGRVRRLGHKKKATATTCVQKCTTRGGHTTCPAWVNNANSASHTRYAKRGFTSVADQAAPGTSDGYSYSYDDEGNTHMYDGDHYSGMITADGTGLLRSAPTPLGESIQDYFDLIDVMEAVADAINDAANESCLCW